MAIQLDCFVAARGAAPRNDKPYHHPKPAALAAARAALPDSPHVSSTRITPGSVWEGTIPDRPPLQGPLTADVCVVGLGGAGLAALDLLAERGVKAIGLDAGRIGGGAAGRNAGFLLGGLADFFNETVTRLGDDLATAIYQQTLDEIRRMAQRHPAAVRLIGSLRIAATSDEIPDCEEHLHALHTHGFPAERYVGPEGRGLLIPTDAVFHPQHCLQADADGITARGVPLCEHSAVTALAPREVTTAGGSVRCDTIIIAVDGGLELLLPELQPRVRTARLQMLATAPARDVSFPRPVYRRHGYDYWQQLPTAELALGGFRDRGGEAEWTQEATAGGIVQDQLEQFLRTQLKTNARITHRWAACVAYTPNRIPVLEEVRPHVFAVGAYSGTGNIPSRLSGRAAAQLALGEKAAWADLLHAAAQRK